MLFVNNFLITGYTCSRVAIFISVTSSELLVTGTSFWIVKEVFAIWCWTCLVELSGTCTTVVWKSNIFVLVSISPFWSLFWYGRGPFRKEVFFSSSPLKPPYTISLSVQSPLWVNGIFCQTGDLHLPSIKLFFPSVMSLFYGDLSAMFSRCLSDVHMRLTVMLSPTEVWYDLNSFRRPASNIFQSFSRDVITDP